MAEKSFKLIWDDENISAQIVCTNPDFELTGPCGLDTFDREAKRLEAELWAAINEGKAKFVEFAKSSRLKGYKTWDDFRAAHPIYKPIKPEGQRSR
jgi:hypothetical protein